MWTAASRAGVAAPTFLAPPSMAPCPEACSSTCRSFCIGIAVGALIGATGLVKSKPPSPEGATPVSVYQPYLRPEALDAADAANHSAMAATQPTRTEAHRQQPATAPAFEPRARAARAVPSCHVAPQ